MTVSKMNGKVKFFEIKADSFFISKIKMCNFAQRNFIYSF